MNPSEAMAKALNGAVEEMMRQRNEISESAAIECIFQAIKCGDFIRYVQGEGEVFTYIPHRELFRMERQRDEARQIAEKYRDADDQHVCSLDNNGRGNSKTELPWEPTA